MKISIARALAEHKLIDKKLEKQMAGAKYCSTKRGRKNETPEGVSIEEFTKKAQSSYDSIKTLLEHKNTLKSAMVHSNAITKVTIGKTEMTVASAIERKRSIEIEQRVLHAMKSEYVRAKNAVEADNMKVQSKLDALLETSFGSGKAGSVKPEEVESISKPYLENNQITLINPLNIEEKINAMEASIDEFIKNIDFALNESNVRTEIELDFDLA